MIGNCESSPSGMLPKSVIRILKFWNGNGKLFKQEYLMDARSTLLSNFLRDLETIVERRKRFLYIF